VRVVCTGACCGAVDARGDVGACCEGGAEGCDVKRRHVPRVCFVSWLSDCDRSEESA